MTEHEEWMRAALREAVSDAAEVPVGAVIVKDGKLIAKAGNRREKADDHDPTAHAEILAIRAAAERLQDRRLTGCTLYVTLEPCPMCAGAVVMSGIDRVVYGASDPRQGCCGSVYTIPADEAFYHRAQVIGGVLERECAALLTGFFSSKR